MTETEIPEVESTALARIGNEYLYREKGGDYVIVDQQGRSRRGKYARMDLHTAAKEIFNWSRVSPAGAREFDLGPHRDWIAEIENPPLG